MKTKKISMRSKFFTENLLVFFEADPPEPALDSEPPEPEKIIPLKTVEQLEREVNRLIEEKRSAEIKVDDEALLEVVKITNDADVLNYAAESRNANVRDEVAQNPATPAETLRKLANDENVYVRASVAHNPKTPSDVLVKLADDRYYEVIDALVDNTSMPYDAWQKLAGDSDVKIREIVAESKYAPAGILAKFGTDKELGVRRAVARNPYTPLKTLSDLLWFEETMADVLMNPKLAEVPDGDWRKGFAGYSGEKFRGVRGAIARNPTTPPSILRMLADDESDFVVFGLSYNPNTPPEVLVKIATKYAHDTLLVAECAKNKNIPLPFLREALMTSKFILVRAYVALNPNAPEDILRILAYDSDDMVRGFVAQHSRTPADILDRLSLDPEHHVRYSVAENPHTPLPVLRYLADDPGWGVRDTARKMLRKRR